MSATTELALVRHQRDPMVLLTDWLLDRRRPGAQDVRLYADEFETE